MDLYVAFVSTENDAKQSHLIATILGIVFARSLVRECIIEAEMNAKNS